MVRKPDAPPPGKPNRWTLAPRGLYVLAPWAEGGPRLEFFPFSARPPEPVRLPGDTNSYHLAGQRVSVSPDGRWALFMRSDREESDIMLVDNFR